MKLKIMQIGEPVLRQQARPLSREQILSPSVQQLIEHMRETMLDAPGVGLAAPQVDQPLQLAVIEDRAEVLATLPEQQLAERERRPVPFQVIINPRLQIIATKAGEAEQRLFFEGCLSAIGLTALVPRAAIVRVECLNHRAEPAVIDASGWHARILQHEIDHLNGTLYVDKMLSRSLMSSDNYARYWASCSVNEVCAALTLTPPSSYSPGDR